MFFVWGHLAINAEKWESRNLSDFLRLLKSVANDFLFVWSIMRVFIICYIPVQTPYLETIWFLRYGSKYYQPIRLQGYKNLKLTMSVTQNDEILQIHENINEI